MLKPFTLAAKGSCTFQGLDSSAQSFYIACSAIEFSFTIAILPDGVEAARTAADAAFFLGGKREVILLPQLEMLPYEPLSPHPDISAERRQALKRMMQLRKTGNYLLVTTHAALLQPAAVEDSGDQHFRLKVGHEVDAAALKTFLTDSGYSFSDPVDATGSFAFRGGILDVFPPAMSRPLRVELFGDEVESIRRFDPDSQMSEGREYDVTIEPLKDASFSGMDMQQLFKKLDGLEQTAFVDDLRQKFTDEVFFPAIELFMPWYRRQLLFPPELLPNKNLPWHLIECEPQRLKQRQELFLEEMIDGYDHAIKRGEQYPTPDESYFADDKLQQLFAGVPKTCLQELALDEESNSCKTVQAAVADRYRGSFSGFIFDAKKRLESGGSTIISLKDEAAGQRLQKLCIDEYAGIKIVEAEQLLAAIFELEQTGEPVIAGCIGQLSSGFSSPDMQLYVTTEEEIFGKAKLTTARRKVKKMVFATDFSDIAPGDYVVHREHGIGEYRGIRDVTSGNGGAEYLEIEYAEDQLLFLPVSSVYLLEKYSGSGGNKPQLDRMGGKAWQKRLEKVRKDIMRMAGELLEIYAKRKVDKPHVYNVDNSMMDDFAGSFEHTETADQRQAIEDVLHDMSSDKPMDRLVCGDVGYGKTEVAMRAAFAASIEGKQTALLVPTTLLVAQHYEKFKERLHPFGVKVGQLSRFVSKKEQQQTLEMLAAGTLDIVIGTHRLLSKDVVFNDLGLVIVDEEQRFGVTHKEKLKKLRATVDILTLTATPIPRTLHMSLSGIKDISVINTPPPNRLSIKTMVRRRDDGIIKEAINREMSRGGQLFFLHNSVDTIYGMQKSLQEIAPTARIAVAHGQMSAEELEQSMDKFIRHKVDMLLCTTIIESGLDIPNANTIIINRADKLGLAQLYQLRGRVGRDKHRAYAYLLVPDAMPELARKRIRAIEELSDLGSGFKLAARDMEIRGTGNMLGPQQSGQITAVGFETYCRMLEEAVQELQSGKKAAKVDTELSLDFVGKLEESYIPKLEQRMNFYNQLYRAENSEQLEAAVQEIADRFGKPPERAERLIDGLRLRISAMRFGVQKLELKGESLRLHFTKTATEHLADVAEAALIKFPGNLRPIGENSLEIGIAQLYATGRESGICHFLDSVKSGEEAK